MLDEELERLVKAREGQDVGPMYLLLCIGTGHHSKVSGGVFEV